MFFKNTLRIINTFKHVILEFQSAKTSTNLIFCDLVKIIWCWFFMWFSAVETCLNRNSHTRQANGFSFVCVRRCLRRSYMSRATYRHAKQGRCEWFFTGGSDGQDVRCASKVFTISDRNFPQWTHVSSEDKMERNEHYKWKSFRRMKPDGLLVMIHIYRATYRKRFSILTI